VTNDWLSPLVGQSRRWWDCLSKNDGQDARPTKEGNCFSAERGISLYNNDMGGDVPQVTQ
jgi:hypothetical protein